jgi:hypothetical protein
MLIIKSKTRDVYPQKAQIGNGAQVVWQKQIKLQIFQKKRNFKLTN